MFVRVLFIIATIISFGSCATRQAHITSSLVTINENKASFVKLKKGGEISIADTEHDLPFNNVTNKNNILIDGKSYKLKEIDSLQFNNEFYKIDGKKILKRVYKGDVNIYERKSIKVSNNNVGGINSTSSRIVTDYYFTSKKVNNGKLYSQHSFLKNNEARKVISLVPESSKHVNKYQTWRNITNISGITSLGLIVGGVVLANVNNNNNMSGIGSTLALSGIVTSGFTLYSFGQRAKQARKSYETYSKYSILDNKPTLYDTMKMVQDKIADNINNPISKTNLDENQNDYIILKDGTQIIAKNGSKLKTNGKHSFFEINGNKYTDVSEFRFQKFKFKKFDFPTPKDKSQYSTLILDGPLKVYSNHRKSISSPYEQITLTSSGNIFSSANDKKIKEIYTRDDLQLFSNDKFNLHSLLQDDPRSLSQYNEYVKNYNKLKNTTTMVGIANIAVVVAGFTMIFVKPEINGSTNNSSLIGSGLLVAGTAIGYWNINNYQAKKKSYEKEFTNILKNFNNK